MPDMKIARIENGTVVEVRELALADVPKHKRKHWREIVDDLPEFDPRIESASESGWKITKAKARKLYVVTRHAREMQVMAIKNETQRRIIAATGASDIIGCLIKQQNGLSPKVEAEITRLRAKSNEIEALDPLPADWASDKRWMA